MLLVNDKKGWYGSFSEAGRRAAKLNLLISKDPTVTENAKKKFTFKGSLVISAFESSENKNKDIPKKDEDIFDIFSIDEPNKQKLEEMARDGIIKSTSKFKSQNQKYTKNEKNKSLFRTQSAILNKSSRNNIQINRRKTNINDSKNLNNNPPCTKYNPKYSAVFKRTPSTPQWCKISGRDLDKSVRRDEHPFYLQHEEILDTMAGKSFINMSKQTTRNLLGFKKINDNKSSKKRPFSAFSKLSKKSNKSLHSSKFQRSKNKSNTMMSKNLSQYKKKDKKFTTKINRPMSGFNARMRRKMYSNESSIINNSKNKSNSKYTSFNNKNNSISSQKKEIIDNISKNDDEEFTQEISEDSYDLYKNIYTKELKNVNKFSIKKSTNKPLIKAPDFKQMISRENLDKLKDDKIPVVPYLLPSFKSVRERPIMMVVYDRKKHKINRCKSATMPRIDNTFYYDPNDILEHINNHVSSHPPNFNLMTSRPDDEDPLPSYMKKIYTRNGCFEMTQLSLKLNNYRNRGFTTLTSSFFPKLSFNKIINLNLLKSKKFLNNVIGNQRKFKSQFKDLGKALTFYNKNYEDILRENFLGRFDNVTYKSIDKEKSKQIVELVEKIKQETKQ